MTRPIAVVVAACILLAGCKAGTSGSPVDPFGRTTVEPPRTGAVGVQAPESAMYVGSRPADVSASTAPSRTTGAGASAAPPATKRGYEPPGGSYDFKGTSTDEARPVAAVGPGDRVTIPAAARELSKRPGVLASGTRPGGRTEPGRKREVPSTSPAVAAAGAPSTADSPGRSAVALAGISASTAPVERERIVRTIVPRPTEAAGEAGGSPPTRAARAGQDQPRRLSPPEGVIDIMDLPAAGASREPTGTHGADAFRLVSDTASSDAGQTAGSRSAGSTAQDDTFTPRARYGHAPTYGWLRGRLEYSQIDRRWKLRYIPIDGATDDFGGSVVIADASVLSGYERGDFVEVHGTLGPTAPDDRHFSPEFEVDQIKGLAD